MNTNPKAKRILIYGDSISWGYIPGTHPNIKRFDISKRYTGILQNLLGTNFEIIEEAMHGRTIDLTDPKEKTNPEFKGRNGFETFFSVLKSHQPLDLIIIQLGKNDLKGRYQKNANDIVNSYKKHIELINNFKFETQNTPPKIILIPPVGIDYIKAEEFRGYPANILKIIDQIFENLEKINYNNIIILDLRNKVETGIDGLHLDEENHRRLAEIIYQKIIKLKF